MSRLQELREQMNNVKNKLQELADLSAYHEQELERIMSEMYEWQREGKRLGEEFREIRNEQKAAIAFVEELVNKE